MSRKTYSKDFKKQIVEFYEAGKSVQELATTYGIGTSTVWKWVQHYKKSGSFQAKDNQSETEKIMIQQQKRIKVLEMENDILKQAALIMGRK